MKNWIKDIPFIYFLATIIVLGIFAFFFMVTFSHSEAVQQAGEIKSVFTATLTAIIGYFFGSSSGSKNKDAALMDSKTKQ